MGIGRHAGNGEPRSPAHARDDVRVAAAALAEHPHRKHPHAGRRAGHADAVVGHRGDQSRDLRAVPRARLRGVRATEELTAWLCDLRLCHPVAGVGGVAVAAVAVVGHGHVTDHVVSRQQAASHGHLEQVRVLVAHAAVQDRDHDLRAAGGQSPGRLDVQRRPDFARRRAQVPLARRRAVAGYALRVEGIVGAADDVAALVGHGVFDVALPSQASRELSRRQSGCEHHLHAVGDGCPGAQRQSQPGAESPCPGPRRFGRRAAAGTRRGRARPELHDHARHVDVGGGRETLREEDRRERGRRSAPSHPAPCRHGTEPGTEVVKGRKRNASRSRGLRLKTSTSRSPSRGR